MKKDHQLSIPNSILKTTETDKENIGKGDCKRWNFFVNCKEAHRQQHQWLKIILNV